MRAGRFAASIAALAAVIWLVVGTGLVNYDTLYALVWGRQIVQGHTPAVDVPIAPTPHPLGTLLGVLLSPLSMLSHAGVHGDPTTTATLALAFLALALLGWVVYALGAAWFDPWVGALAAVIILTRQPVLDFGARAYVDIPYVVLVLGALLLETRRPRCGVPVLALLAVAGLIRPEAWLFSGLYVLYLIWAGERDGARIARLVAVAAAAPVLWMLSDWAIAGDPLHSLTGTRDTAQELGRVTGIGQVPTTAPRRIGEILREPVLVGALGGLILAWLWLRTRVRLAILAGVVSLLAFTLLAAAGLPILGRYLLLPASIGAVLCGAGAFGWRALPAGDPRRRPWAWFGVLVLVLLVVFTPAQISRIRNLRHALARQDQIQDDLRALVHSPPGLITARCRPVGVPNHRPVPLLALWLDLDPRAVISAQERRTALGTYVRPATPTVADDYILDPRDEDQSVAPPPTSFHLAGGNRSWLVYKRCAPDVVVHSGE